MAYGKKPASYYERKMNKILSGLYPFDDSAKEFLDVLRSAVGEASRKLVKGFSAQPRDQMYLEDIYDTGHYYVESAIWLTWENNVLAEQKRLGMEDNDIPPEMTLPIWQGLCSKAAFGSITDPLRYYAMMQDPAFVAKVRAEQAYVYRNMMWMLVVFYILLWRLETLIHGTPVLGITYALFMFMVLDMSKIYGLISMVYWLEYMDVHPVISSWMPRDPYVLAKRLAAWQLKLIPLSLARALPFAALSGSGGQLCIYLAQLFNRAQSLKPLAGHGSPIHNPWTGDAHRMLQLLADPQQTPDNAIVLNSQTGTGKSALGTDALQRLLEVDVNADTRMWVFVPTRILLKDPLPAFLQRGQDSDPEHQKTYQVLRRGVAIRSNARILFMTYGHGRNRLLAGEFRRGIDTAFVDEMHMLSAEQRLVCQELRGERIIFSSATHVPPPGFTAPVFRSSQQKKWKAYQRVFPATTNVASMFQRARNDTQPIMGMRHSPKELSERTLILCATFRELEEVKESLLTLRKSTFGSGIGVSLPPVVEISSKIKPGSTEWSARQKAFESGTYVALGTKQAATGMDIKPFPPWLLIDGGEDIYSHEGQIVKLPTTPRDHEQRLGRVTRNSSDRDGLVYCREQAASRGWDTIEYPAVSYLNEKLISDAYKLPLLLPVQTPALEDWPYFRIMPYDKSITEALVFCTLATASGVSASNLESFYMTHWYNGIRLSDDYEWMDSLLKKQGRRTIFSPPSWMVLEASIAAKPILWNTTGIMGSISHQDGLQQADFLFPVAGNYLGFQESRASPVRRVLDYEAKGNTIDTIAAERLNHAHDLIQRQAKEIRQLRAGQQPRDPTPSNQLRLAQTRQALYASLEKHLAGKQTSFSKALQPLIREHELREREPAGVYTGPDLSDPNDTTLGWGYCSIDGTPAIIGESGPAAGITGPLSCGHHAHAPGDHLINPNFTVVRRGSNWTSVYPLSHLGDSDSFKLFSLYITDEVLTPLMNDPRRRAKPK